MRQAFVVTALLALLVPITLFVVNETSLAKRPVASAESASPAEALWSWLWRLPASTRGVGNNRILVTNQQAAGALTAALDWLAHGVGRLRIGKPSGTLPNWGGSAARSASSGPPPANVAFGSVVLPAQGAGDPTGSPRQDGDVPPPRDASFGQTSDADRDYALGLQYRDGDGEPVDPAAALHWLLAAAERGHPRAEIDVAAMYASGVGTVRNDVAAYMWAALAAARLADPSERQQAIDARDRAALAMTPAQLAAARDLVTSWAQKIPPVLASE